jgi:uncharacterized protein (TIGR00369 family)
MADAAHKDRLIALFASSTIARSMELVLSYDASDRAVLELPYTGRYDHFLDDVHGGAIAAMVDNAGWFAAAVRYPTWIVSIEFQVRYHEPAGREPLTAVGTILRAGKRITQASMEVQNRSGVLVATGSGSFAVTSSPLPDPAARSMERPAGGARRQG